MTTPQFIKRDSMLTDTDYVQWLSDLKQRYRQSQAKAAVHVNHGMLVFYWSLGRDIVALKAESKWGSDFFNQLSVDLKQTFPQQKGFSVTNLKYIKRWYLFYYEQIIIRQQPADEFKETIRQQLADKLEMPVKFALIPLYHHIEIATKCHSLQEAFFYINQVIEGN